MTRFSSIDAALEGLRVIKREPLAVLYWIAVWAFALAMIAIVRLATGSPTAALLFRFTPGVSGTITGGWSLLNYALLPTPPNTGPVNILLLDSLNTPILAQRNVTPQHL